ncbi:primase-helicase family protein [Pyxidicoccus caerfyrddinensis]|uniref:primase-helicase family protein n=1 Tax=Pyxidicoccus caerfyrddinensis TaxID=2709663 RepID=UPI0013DD7CAD|nr:primase-helicase family protein [Pyxidicoccus caerfyrddinensis]
MSTTIHPGDALAHAADTEAALAQVAKLPLVKVVPLERYLARRHDGRGFAPEFLTQKAAEDYLILRGLVDPRNMWPRGVSPLAASPNVPGLCAGVMAIECKPNAPDLLMRKDETLAVNTWEAPTLVPVSGDWSDVRRVLLWLAEDEAGLDWLLNWIAFKVQNPGSRPGTAILLQGPPGSGKNVLYRVLAHLLGPSNCVQIGEADLAKPYNLHFATKLLIFANELLDNHKRGGSLGDGLKAMITDSEVFLESKGVPRTPASNRAGLLAATNRTKPIEIEENDRRWTVFHNKNKPAEYQHPDLGMTHREFLESLHAPGEDDAFTPEFMRQVAAFAHAMGIRAVDLRRVRRPHANESRMELQQLSEPVTEQFLRELKESPDGDGQLRDWAMNSPQANVMHRGGAQVGKTKAFTNDALYAAVCGFCRVVGQKHPPQKRTFLAALKSAGWTEQRDSKTRGWLPPWHQTGDDAAAFATKVVPLTGPRSAAGVSAGASHSSAEPTPGHATPTNGSGATR